MELYNKMTIREQVYHAIKEKIVTLQLEPGAMVSENELAEQLNVSRTPVHDSLMLLSENHLVDIFPQRGSRISLIDLDWIDEAAFIRKSLEEAVVLDLFGKVTEAEYQELRQCIEQQKTALANGQTSDFLKSDNAYHQLFYKFSKKNKTMQIINNISVHFDRIRAMSVRVDPIQPLIDDHEKILSALAAQDHAALSEIVAIHMTRYKRSLNEMTRQCSDYFLHHE